jgi:hypothetical protein
LYAKGSRVIYSDTVVRTAMPPMRMAVRPQVPRASAAVCALGSGGERDRVLVAGGLGNGNECIGSLELYDPAAGGGRWALLEGMALREPRRGLRAARSFVSDHGTGRALAPIVLLLGGETQVRCAAVQCS